MAIDLTMRIVLSMRMQAQSVIWLHFSKVERFVVIVVVLIWKN